MPSTTSLPRYARSAIVMRLRDMPEIPFAVEARIMSH